MTGARQKGMLLVCTLAASLAAAAALTAAEPMVVTESNLATQSGLLVPAGTAYDSGVLPADARYFAAPGAYPPNRFISYPKTTVPVSPWYFAADAVALKRDPDGDRPFAALGTREWEEDGGVWESTDTRTIVLGTQNFDFDFAGGGRAVIGRRLGDWYAVEVSYMQVNSWREAAAVRDDSVFVAEVDDTTGDPTAEYVGSLFSPFSDFGDPPVLGLDYNNLVSIDSFSEFYDFEFNLRRTITMPPDRLQVSLLVGGRYMNIGERFSYFSSSYYPPNLPTPGVPPNPALTTTNDVRLTAGNTLLGAQIGAFFEFYVDPGWWIDFEIKGVIFDNRASQRSAGSITTAIETRDVDGFIDGYVVTNSPVNNTRVEENHTAGALDLDLTLSWQVNSWLTGRIGYRALWIDGLALASENFQTDVGLLTLGPPQLNTDGKVVYHGPHIGLTGAW